MPRTLLFAAAVIAGPLLLFWHLHLLWNPEGAYSYGWAVPLLAAYLFKSRWDDRPALGPPRRAGALFAIVCALMLLPARWLQEAAPERTACAWIYGAACAGIAISLIALAGGASWAGWFSFPLLFILTAIPWPHTLELLLSSSLMSGTAAATVQILCFIGIPAVQAGNLVHLENGIIDIDEACSGIRSLQAMVMISLFLGELFRLKPTRRLLLMVLGLGVTLVANIIRTVILSGIAFHRGMGAVDAWHDGTGFAVLIFSLTGALLIAFLLHSRKNPALPSGVAVPAEGWNLPVKLCTALLAWFAIHEIAVEAWYRAHETKWEGWSWSVRWPESADGFHAIDIPRNSVRLLMCDESHAASWSEPGGDWTVYWIRWNPGNPQAESAKVHRPDVCLNAEGAIMGKDMGTQPGVVGPLRIPFHSYTFRLSEKTLYVFYCLYEEGPGDRSHAANLQFEAVDMLQRALQGRRHIGGQSLEVALSGYASEAAARAAFERRLSALVQTK